MIRKSDLIGNIEQFIRHLSLASPAQSCGNQILLGEGVLRTSAFFLTLLHYFSPRWLKKKKKKRISVVSWEILSHQSPRAGFYQIERCEFACVGRSWLSTAFDVKTMTQFSCSHDASYLCRVYSSPDSFTDKEAVKMAKVGAREQRLRQSDTGTGSHVWFGKNHDAKKETYIV